MPRVPAVALLLLLASPLLANPPARPGAAEPHLFATRDGRLLLSWLEPAGGKSVALRFATMKDGRWSEARTVVQRDDLFVNWADFPSVVEDEKGVLFAHWLQRSGAGTYAYDVRMSTSRDGGKSWSASRVIHRDGKEGEHGFASLVPLAGGGVGAVWLDGREMNGHHGSMTMRYARIGADLSLRDEALLDGRTCECCATGMTMTTSGLVAVYRDRTANEVRDISVVRLANGKWSAPRALHADGWKIAGCPVNGPQIDARGDRVAVAWYTEAGAKPRVQLAFSSDGGKTFGKPVQVDGGAPAGRVDVLLLADGGALVTWIEGKDEKAIIAARRVHADGRLGAIARLAGSSSARSAGFPRAALVGKTAWFTWTEPSAPKKIHVAKLDV